MTGGSNPTLAVVNPTTGKLLLSSNATLPWSPWAMAYDNKTDSLLGVWVNENTQVIQVVKLMPKTGGHKVICELPTSPSRWNPRSRRLECAASPRR